MLHRDFAGHYFGRYLKRIKKRMKRKMYFYIFGIMITMAACVSTGIAQQSGTAEPVPRQQTSVIGYASYYAYECASQPMANGKPFNPEARTCASWFHKFGTMLTVKSLDTGRQTKVVVTDRGPNKRFVKTGRIIDLSKRAFEDICDLRKGLTRVEITVNG